MEEPNLLNLSAASMSHFPNELVSNIIKNFGRLDVLTARLVSHDWNREVRRYLIKSSGYKIHLNENYSLKNYIAFQNQLKSGYILPFHLKFSARSRNFDYAYELDTFGTNVDLLIQMFGKDCVHTLEFEFGYQRDQTKCMELLITLLDKFSTGLKSIQFEGPSHHVNLDFNEAVRKLQQPALTLPNVTEVETGSCGALLYWFLIQKCPRVQKLLISFSHATKDEISSLPLANVTTLVIYLETLLEPLVQQVIRSQTPLRLKNLTFIWNNYDNANANGNMSAEAIQVLCSLCETLESLTILVYRYEYLDDRDPIPLPFTAGKSFPRLTSLIIRFIYEAKKPDDLDLVIDPALFPALTSVEFPHNVNLKTATATEFPNVKTLTLLAKNLSAEGVHVFPYKTYAQNYLRIFPNVTRVRVIKGVVIRNRDDDNGGRVVREVLQGLIQSEIDTSAKIQELELIACPQNYLGEVLHHQSHPPRITLDNLPRDSILYQNLVNMFQGMGRSGVEISDGQGMTGQTVVGELVPPIGTVNHMTNVRKVSIIMNRFSWSNISKRYKHIESLGEDKSKMIANILSKPMELHVDIMLKSLPKLDEIKISSVLFGSDANAKNKLVQDFYTHHPKLKLNIV